MAKSSQEVIFEGWLTKSPPTKRIFRARWRKRYFSLTNSGELPGQYILTYYTDKHCRKLKGTINLDTCEQVDLGLKFEERKLKFDHVFDIKTPGRTYYLAADTEDEMRKWVDNICKVCGLKSSEEPVTKNSGDVIITGELQANNFIETPPISPVSTSPYIPISECITGKSPIFDTRDLKSLLAYNMRNSHHNEMYDTMNLSNRHNSTYINDPRFYDCPRQLQPPLSQLEQAKHDYQNSSPLQSPTDTESVFTDEDWPHNASSDLNSTKNTRPSESSADMDVTAAQKFIKNAPPRPPKPSHVVPGPCYLNLTPTQQFQENEENLESNMNNDSQGQKLVSDDIYDFPRSHNVDSDTLKSNSTNTAGRRHCYNNAAPGGVEGTIFKWDISPKPGTSNKTIFRYDMDEIQDEPASPHSQTSSTAAYSNLPSPLLTETQLMPPPIVNRGLKPKRKLSDSHSINSNPEPPSPRGAPCVDRKLKPPTPLQEPHMRKSFNTEDDTRKIRAAPSPTPPNLGRSHESLLMKSEESYLAKMQYLDLDLEGIGGLGNKKNKPVKVNETDTVYKKVDFMKTQAFINTRNNLEKQRQEPLTFKK